MGINALDRSSPMPLWAQLEAELRQRLDDGDFSDAFPTDLELTGVYEVSRHTVREAIRHLNVTGVLRRERGRGTVVNKAEFEQPLGTLYSLFQSVESTGVEQTSEVLRLEVVVDEAAAARLGVPAPTELVLLERVRLAGGSPLAVDTAWMSADVTRPLLQVDWSHTALYGELARLGAPVPTAGWERLTPIIPVARDRQLLGLRNTDAAFFLERLGSHDGAPIEWRTTVIRGDRYRFVSDWMPGSRPELRPAVSSSS